MSRPKDKRTLENLNSPWWDQALADLEERNPKRLTQLLNSGLLEKYLNDQVVAAQRLGGQLMQEHPELEMEAMQELIHREVINQPVAGYDPEHVEELSPVVERKLAAFRKQMQNWAELVPIT